ncbi:cryptochrome DASH [Acrasis kona]|uniref:Cryptochrome DASH n=1 Tax=Acrasis kona TaxID=1008807 RepID=A0AAW2ZLJ7_9EUKA
MDKIKNGTVLVWLRNDLRILDNEALTKGIKFSEDKKYKIVPIVCFDPRHYEKSMVGHIRKTQNLRAKFLIESVDDLRKNLNRIGGNLMIKVGRPEDVIKNIIEDLNVKKVFAHKEVGSEETTVENGVSKVVDLDLLWSHTLVHPDDLPKGTTPMTIPMTFASFRNRILKDLKVRDPIPEPKDLKDITPELSEQEWGTVPSLTDLGFDSNKIEPEKRAVMKFTGGETEGIKRTKAYIWNKSQPLSDYANTRNGLIGADYSSKFSPWMSVGCISPRYIYQQVKLYEKKYKSNDGIEALIRELFFRDYFRYLGQKVGNKIFKISGIRNYNGKDEPTWDTDPEKLKRWCEGRTGHPMVDANIREMNLSGWMSNRGRMITSSFFSRDMGMDWRLGAEYFEAKLIDYDVTSNWCNWMYIAGVGNDPRGGSRSFNMIKQAKDFDPKGEYIKSWIPELKNVPIPKLPVPWLLTASERKQYGCEDYPEPVVEVPLPASMKPKKKAEPGAKKRKATTNIALSPKKAKKE